MDLILKAAYFDSGQVFGIAARLNEGKETQASHAVAFPTGATPEEVVRKLRDLASWIETNSKDASDGKA